MRFIALLLTLSLFIDPAAAQDRTPEDPKLVWTASSVVLISKELAAGVYAVYPDDAAAKNAAGIPAATSGGFVVGDDGVLVIDSMLNRRLANQLLALIREKTNKPILFVVNTSYHGDHSYGNQFFPHGTQFVQHVSTQTYIQSHFADDIAFMTQFFGSNQGLDELKPQRAQVLLRDGMSVDLDLGGKTVQVMHLGFAQTDGDLFVWLPKEKVVYTGNPIISDGPSLPWLLDGKLHASLTTMRRLRTMLPNDAIVVPGHGAPTSVKAVEQPIRYLEELGRRVSDAIEEGLSEQETVARLTESMKQYSGYKIYPWVHAEINVTKTYQELKKGKPAAVLKPPARPANQIDRSAEDWSFLRDRTKRGDPWDPIKYIPIGPSDQYVTIGGEFRPSYELYRNHAWGAGAQDDDGFYLQRAMLHADLHMRRVRFFVELKSGIARGRTGGPRAADEDKLDVNGAFVDLSGARVRFRIGRQEIHYGDGGMLAIREGPNVRRAFDGAKVILRFAGWQVDAFALRPNKTHDGYFDDGPDHDQTLLGVYTSSRSNFAPFFGQIEPFYVYLERKQARFDQGIGREERHTVAVHTINRRGGLTYEFSGYLQFGKFAGADIHAWKNVETVSYTFEKQRWRPSVGLNVAISSGDRDPSDPDLQTFHPLFPKGLYYGRIDSVGSLNALVVHPRTNLKLTPSVTLNIDIFAFWRQRTSDGAYSQPGFLLRTGQSSSARFLGSLYEMELVRTLGAHATTALQVGYFAVGTFFLDTPPGENTTYVATKLTYKF